MKVDKNKKFIELVKKDEEEGNVFLSLSPGN